VRKTRREDDKSLRRWTGLNSVDHAGVIGKFSNFGRSRQLEFVTHLGKEDFRVSGQNAEENLRHISPGGLLKTAKQITPVY